MIDGEERDAFGMIHHGDLFDVLPTLVAESLDSCVTDPPYGIGFMGKQWDSFSPETAQRKAGLRQRGKLPRVKDTNPNLKGRTVNGVISTSQIEYNRSLDGQRGFQEWTERWAREVFRVLKPGAHLVVCGAPRSHHRMMCGLEDAGFEIRDCLAWLFGSGFPKSRNLGAGWGTALKPGHEPIALARKPFKGSITANHQTRGVGGLNVDECRIDGLKPLREPIESANRNNPILHTKSATGGNELTDVGRWPTNVLLDPGVSEMVNGISGDVARFFVRIDDGVGPLCDLCSEPMMMDTRDAADQADDGECGIRPIQWVCFCNSGNYRVLYTPKPSRKERDLGCEGLNALPRDDSRKEGNPGGDNPRNRGLQPRGNFHPTVKPLALMRWLVRLVTPQGGTVLEPFGGSGTTAMACAAEGLAFVLIEREAEYIPIIEARVRSIAPLFTEALR